MKKGILVVSFGTSYKDTREVTISAIENAIQHAYPDIPLYTAWTSKMIMAKLQRTTGEKICNVSEALSKMQANGITDVYVQPTHIIPGIEYDCLCEDVQEFHDAFQSITVGRPLLSSTDDMQEVISIIAKEFSEIADSKDAKDMKNSTSVSAEALVLMGHGSEHYANTTYAALDYMCKQMGYMNIHVGTVEAYPSLDDVLHLLQKSDVKKVHLAPLLIVAGDHARNDMAGDEDDSWKRVLEAQGYEVVCHLRGLGEYAQIQQMFVAHLQELL